MVIRTRYGRAKIEAAQKPVERTSRLQTLESIEQRTLAELKANPFYQALNGFANLAEFYIDELHLDFLWGTPYD